MVDRRSAEPSPAAIARANRQRLAQEEGARAMEDVTREAVAIRKNMARLRELRLAKEAEQALLPKPDTSGEKKPRKKAAK
ncbi:MAG: transcriptional regulator [Bradyrhizobium sp.]|uniref:transcriptional regulator n=1 Tax=Bradyrhizobium sp. TaxID=376 RepID=UPI002A3562D6|nr:transcriptional regulator [Bradyrhizobium sp.]